jgi:hypothetical protein
MFVADAFKYRTELPARPAPRCPKVDEHERVFRDNRRFESAFVKLYGCHESLSVVPIV